MHKGCIFFLANYPQKKRIWVRFFSGISHHVLNYSSWSSGCKCCVYEKGDVAHEGDSYHREFLMLFLMLFVPLICVGRSNKCLIFWQCWYYHGSAQILLNDLPQYLPEWHIHSNNHGIDNDVGETETLRFHFLLQNTQWVRRTGVQSIHA